MRHQPRNLLLCVRVRREHRGLSLGALRALARALAVDLDDLERVGQGDSRPERERAAQALQSAGPMRAPRRFIRSAKPGKLVAIGVPSSMTTAARAAPPRTRKLIAMR